jgi:hypothetical protein
LCVEDCVRLLVELSDQSWSHPFPDFFGSKEPSNLKAARISGSLSRNKSLFKMVNGFLQNKQSRAPNQTGSWDTCIIAECFK